MKKYYLLEGNKVVGPYTIDQLKEKSLRVDTLLCSEGTEEWKKISEFPELGVLKHILPPPAPPRELYKKTTLANSIRYVFSKAYLSKLFTIIGASLILGVVVGIICFYSSSGGNHLRSYNEYHRYIQKYEITNVREFVNSDAKDADLRANTNWESDRWVFRDIFHAESYFKEKYLKYKSKAINYGVISTQ